MISDKRESLEEDFSVQSPFAFVGSQPFFIGQQGWERRGLKYRKQSGANSNSAPVVRTLMFNIWLTYSIKWATAGPLIQSITVSLKTRMRLTIILLPNSPISSHQGGEMDVKNGESEWSSCPRNKPSRMTAPTMQPAPAQMVWREIFNFTSKMSSRKSSWPWDVPWYKFSSLSRSNRSM